MHLALSKMGAYVRKKVVIGEVNFGGAELRLIF